MFSYKNINTIKKVILTLFFLVVFLSFFNSDVFAAKLNYTYKISEDGEVTTFIFIDGYEIVDITIPEISSIPQIRGGIYIDTPDGIEVSVGNTKKAIVAYRSSYHTEKKDGIWYFNSNIKNNSTVEIIFPLNTEIVRSSPKGIIQRKENYVEMSFLNTPNSINTSYMITDLSQEELDVTEILNDEEKNNDENNSNNIILIILVIIIFSTLSFMFFIFRTKKGTKKIIKENTINEKINEKVNENNLSKNDDIIPNITEAQLNIIRAANQNEALIIRIIARNNCHIKRNILEKESNLSKSSLASSLNNLEKKNIVQIDRTFKVHYIKFSDWFGDLK